MAVADGFQSYLQSFTAGLRPRQKLWVDEWADRHMVIPSSTGAAEPGKYRLSRTPYAAEIMRCLSPGFPCRRVVVKGASQLLKTQVGLNWFCSIIACEPANAIWLQPTDALAKRVSARFDKTVDAVDVLHGVVAKKSSRRSRNTLNSKEFVGGTLWILTGRSASNLSEASARWVYADEVDRILRELKGEGDPIALLEKRQATFGSKAKGYYTSSPTEAGSSRIDEMYQQGDQRKLYVPCPHCLEMQTLEWESMLIDLEAGRAQYVCINGCIIDEHHKTGMLANSEWRPTAGGDGETVSFEINFLYAPLGWDSWLKLGQEHAEAVKAEKEGDPEKMRVFWNTRLARTWSPVATRIKPDELSERAEPYRRGIVPAGARMLTASVDVQQNRLEAMIVGWGPGTTGLEAWIVDHHVIIGDPTVGEVWEELDTLLMTPVRSQHRTLMPIRVAMVDSGDGNMAQEVYEFCRPRRTRLVEGQRQKVIAIKGSSTAKRPVLAGKPAKVEYSYRGSPRPGSVEVWSIGTDTAKDWILNRLALKDDIAIHTSTEFDRGLYEQLLSEALVSKWVNGKRRVRYERVSKTVRNEALDLMVYNLAAAHYLGLPQYSSDKWAKTDLGVHFVGDIAAHPVRAAPVHVQEKPNDEQRSKRLVRRPRPLHHQGVAARDGWAL